MRFPRRTLHLVMSLIAVNSLATAFVFYAVSIQRTARHHSASVSDVSATAPLPKFNRQRLPWGNLRSETVTIGAPIEFARLINPNQYSNDWFFPEMTRKELSALLTDFGLTGEQLQQLLDQSQVDPLTHRRRIPVTDEVIREIPLDVRSKLYLYLEEDDLNVAQANAFRFAGNSVDDWFRGSSIRREVIEQIRSMAYRSGSYLKFADIRLLLPELRDATEIAAVFQVLSRVKTLIVWLHVDEKSDLSKLCRYWGRGGRTEKVRILLDSVSQIPGGGSIDITHLLPSFARRRLYTYPNVSLDHLSSRQDCHWTAHNFFSSSPDNRIAENIEIRTQILNEEYFEVFGDYQFGDVLAYIDEDGLLLHSCVYIAGNIVFTKTGADPLRPWYLLTLNEMFDFYDQRKAVRVKCYRQKRA